VRLILPPLLPRVPLPCAPGSPQDATLRWRRQESRWWALLRSIEVGGISRALSSAGLSTSQGHEIRDWKERILALPSGPNLLFPHRAAYGPPAKLKGTSSTPATAIGFRFMPWRLPRKWEAPLPQAHRGESPDSAPYLWSRPPLTADTLSSAMPIWTISDVEHFRRR
jgi:hypothetical protein